MLVNAAMRRDSHVADACDDFQARNMVTQLFLIEAQIVSTIHLSLCVYVIF